MRRRWRFHHRPCWLLLLLLVLAGCSSMNMIGPDVRLTALRTEQPVNAWLADNLLIVHYQVDKDQTYTAAQWVGGELPKIRFDHQYSRMEFLGDQWPDVLVGTNEVQPVQVVSSSIWQLLLTQLVDELVPQTPDQAIVLLIRNNKRVIYRLEDGSLGQWVFGEQPQNLVIVNSFDEDGFLENIAKQLERIATEAGLTGRQLLFMTNTLSRTSADLILLDRDRLELVAISMPIGDENTASRSLVGLSLDSLNSIVVRSHLLAFIKNPVTSVARLLNFAITTTFTLINPMEDGRASDLPEAGTKPPMNLEIWEATLDELVKYEPIPAKLTFLIDGNAYFSDLLHQFNLARNRIDIRVYIFDNDDYAVAIADQLKALSSRVKIKVLVDDLGTLIAGALPPGSDMPADFVPPASITSYLKEDSDIRVRRTANTWLTSDHTKTLIIDNEIAYLGGMNLGREYRYEWHDLMVRLEGPFVDHLRGDFSRAWGHAGFGGDLDYLWRTIRYGRQIHAQPEPGQIMVRPLYTGTGELEIFRVQREAIRRARNYIYIQNAYLSDNVILQELIDARKRGVDVRVIIPGDNDSGIMAASNAVTANVLIAHGVRVYKYPFMSHVKAAIYDGWACLGSANFDKLSLYVNQEMNIGFSDPATVNALKRDLFEKDFELSTEVTEPIRAEWSDYLAEIFANQL